MKSRRPATAGLPLTLLLAWLVCYPLLLTLLEALGAPHLTLEHFREFARRPDEWQALWASLWISAATVGISAAIGIPLGFLFERVDFPGRRFLSALVALPVVLPPLVGVVAFLFLYGESGFLSRGIQALTGSQEPPWRLSGAGAILLVHGYSMYVYFYLFTRAGLARLDAAYLEAAKGLGSRRVRTTIRISLPLISPALAGAALLTFMTSLASFSAPYIFGGNFRVMTTRIVASRLNGDVELAMVESLALAVAALAGLAVMQHTGAARDVAGAVRGIAPARKTLGRPSLVITALASILALFLLLPHATLLLISFVPRGTWRAEALPPVLDLSNYAALFSEPGRLRPIVNSLAMATVATAGALVLGFAAAWLAVARRSRWGRWLETLIAVPWALPGTVFAIALAATFSRNAPWVGRLVLVGTAAILPLAYLVRNLPLTGRAAFAGLRQIDPALGEAAASLGASPARRLWRVIVPLLRPALAAGAALAFITALGDFVVSILLYTYDTRPISIEILSSLRLQETGVAAAYGVLLAVLSGAVFFLWGSGAKDRVSSG